ncbi:DUF5710 domain-containing protein [Rhizobium laguerreae]|uniref:DUF5710 domain-containing protein n=1 Tax=Rhizobium laguerreae TaxID=1076926 RepID=UPI001C8FE963
MCSGYDTSPLSVPYARKDQAKGIGARWSLTDKSWWCRRTTAPHSPRRGHSAFLTFKRGRAGGRTSRANDRTTRI